MVLSKDSFLSKTEVAGILGISNPTLNKLMKQTDLPCTKIGHKYVFSSELINEWILKRSIEKTDIVVEGA